MPDRYAIILQSNYLVIRFGDSLPQTSDRKILTRETIMITRRISLQAILAVGFCVHAMGPAMPQSNSSRQIKLVVPVAFYAMGTLVSVIQAFVFTLLSMIYVALAISHGSEEGHGQESHH
jgi:hypothetical protein